MYRFAQNAFIGAIILMILEITHAAKPPVEVFVTVARVKQIEDRVEALGTLKANESVSLTASVTETVSSIQFESGDRVSTGKVLVEMTSSEEHALLEEARVNVNEARRQYERIRLLVDEGSASRSLLDQRKREWEAAEARLTAIKSRLADRLITAPFSGVLGLRNISVGALVEPGDLITTLDDDSVMKLDFPVPSTFLNTLQIGLPVVATTPSYGEQTFNGKVENIDSRIDPVTRAITVRAFLPNPDRLLKPGMLMQLELLVNSRNSIIIPEQALMPKGTQHFTLVVNESQDNEVTRREVHIGARRPGEVEILEGLRAGEKVITEGKLKVKPGDKVQIRAVDDGDRPLHEMLTSKPVADSK